MAAPPPPAPAAAPADNSPPAMPPATEPTNAAPTEPKPFRLMDLAPELRIEIYKHALIEEKPVPVHTNLKQPALLRVSKQVRKEAKSLWYTSNTFSIPLLSCDTTLLSKFVAHRDAVYDAKDFPAPKEGEDYYKYQIVWGGRPHWRNLLVWCERVYYGGIQLCEDRNRCPVVFEALQMAKALSGKVSWSEVRELLELNRPMYGIKDQRWLDDI